MILKADAEKCTQQREEENTLPRIRLRSQRSPVFFSSNKNGRDDER